MLWLTITITAYFLFAAVFLIDKYLLTGPVPNPKVYSFYIGVFGILVLILVPFINIQIPSGTDVVFAFISGASFIWGIFWFFKGLRIYEASRIIPAVGAILPIFTALLVFIFSGGKEILKINDFFALSLLIVGSFFITYEKTKRISLSSLKISVISAFFFALSFIFAKYVYENQSFLSGLVWIRAGGFLTVLFFLLSKDLRSSLFKEKTSFSKKTITVFFASQAGGALANILQNWAVALVPLARIAFINALQGVQYVFLLIFTIFLSLKFPKILKEEISKKAIFQKIVAILLIGGGLAFLATR